MESERKYITNKITQFTRNRLIIRKGGYYPVRMTALICSAALFMTLVAYLFTIENNWWQTLLYPLCLILFFGPQIIRVTSVFGQKISINNKRILIQSYQGLGSKIIFKKAHIKSMICTREGNNYHFKIWNIKNKKIEFTIANHRKRNPLDYIIGFLGVQKQHISTNKNKTTTRYWTRNLDHVREKRKIQDIGVELFDYRSDYFKISTNTNRLVINSLDEKCRIIFDKNKRTLNYINEKQQSRSINTKLIKSIQYHIRESTPEQKGYQFSILLTATTYDNQEISLLREIHTEKDPGNLDIIDIELDYKNLVAIIDMKIKSAIDEDLDILDLTSKSPGTLELKPLPEIKKNEGLI